nr:MAG TPA: DNA-directed RNA polymerase [Caudoviricetes sp.]
MAEYIEREKTVERLRSLGNREYRKEKGTIQDAIKMISYPEYTPAADVAPVVHGVWVCVNKIDPISGYRCSKCRRRVGFDLTPYCPNCGAKMDGGDSDATD